MILYLILLLLGVLLVKQVRKSRRDLDFDISMYENQKIIVGNQHSIAEALILIMKLANSVGVNHATITKLPAVVNKYVYNCNSSRYNYHDHC